MRIIFDLRGCQINIERGIPRYIQNLIFFVAKKAENNTYKFLYDKKLKKALWHDKLSTLGDFLYEEDLGEEADFDWYIIGCPFWISNEKSLAEYLIPRTHRRGQFKKLAAIVYDFIPLRFPKEYLSEISNQIHYSEALDVLKIQNIIFTISQFVKEEAEDILSDLPPDKIININGGLGFFNGVMPETHLDFAKLKKKYGLSLKDYWIYVGGDDHRKNLNFLIQAQINRTEPKKPLVIVCKLSANRQAEVNAVIKRNKAANVILTGYVDDDALICLLRSAYGMVFPSISEGLGLPILESYNSNTPVLCSNTTSLKDLAPSPLQFNPYNVNELSEKMDLAERDYENFRELSLNYWNSIQNRYNWEYASSVFLEKISHYC